MDRNRYWKVLSLILFLAGTGFFMRIFSSQVWGDGPTCVSVYDTRVGHMVPCGWSPPPTPYTPPGPSPQEIEQRRVRALQNANRMGIAAYRRGDYEEALQDFKEALKFSPYNPTLINNLKKVQLKLREIQTQPQVPEQPQPEAQEQQPVVSPALRQAQDAQQHGERAQESANIKAYVPAASKSQSCFDTGCNGNGNGVLELPRIPGWRPKVSKEVAHDPTYHKMDQQMTALIHRYRIIQKRVIHLEHKLQNVMNHTQKQQIQIAIVHMKTDRAKITTQAAMLHKKMVDLSVQLTAESP